MFSLSEKSKNQIPCFPCAVTTLEIVNDEEKSNKMTKKLSMNILTKNTACKKKSLPGYFVTNDNNICNLIRKARLKARRMTLYLQDTCSNRVSSCCSWSPRGQSLIVNLLRCQSHSTEWTGNPIVPHLSFSLRTGAKSNT